MFRLLLTLFTLAALLPAGEPLPLSGLAHVGFLSSDLAKAAQFYTGVLGYERAFDVKNENGETALAYFKINDEQFIEVFPGLKPDQDVRMNHVAIYTPDIEKLRTMLAERSLEPTAIQKGRDGNRNCSIKDPDGMRIEFVQYMPGSLHTNARSKFLSERRISTHLRHAGVPVANLDAAMAFYRDKLGFEETWRGGPNETDLRWVNLRMPGPSGDYLELMLHSTPPSRASLGSMLHICLEVPDIERAWKMARDHGVPDEDRYKPRTGHNRKRQLNLFDPDGSRSELMEPKTSDAVALH